MRRGTEWRWTEHCVVIVRSAETNRGIKFQFQTPLPDTWDIRGCQWQR